MQAHTGCWADQKVLCLQGYDVSEGRAAEVIKDVQGQVFHTIQLPFYENGSVFNVLCQCCEVSDSSHCLKLLEQSKQLAGREPRAEFKIRLKHFRNSNSCGGFVPVSIESVRCGSLGQLVIGDVATWILRVPFDRPFVATVSFLGLTRC